MTELWEFGAAELAALIRARQASCREVIDAHLERIAVVNPAINAITVVMADEAREAADEADQQTASAGSMAMLRGVPFTVKENIDVAATATTWGISALRDALADTDAPLVANLRLEGAIPIGRTNMPDFALRWHTDNDIHGATLNPWDASITPGGSSGGDAAAVAVGMTPLGIGNDVGGSLRYPTQCCGAVALRPTLGRVPHASCIEPIDAAIGMQLMNTNGPIARRVGDLRLALNAISRASSRDPWWVPAPLTGPPLDSPIRVAVVRDPAGRGVDPKIASAIDTAAEALAAAGYLVDDVEPPGILEATAVWGQLTSMSLQALLPRAGDLVSDDAAKYLSYASRLLPSPDISSFAATFVERARLLRTWSQFFIHHPLILAPISTMLPFKVGADLDPDWAAKIMHSMHMVVAVNALGLPSVAIPVQFEDLPQAVQLIGARFREDTCLDAAEAVERQLGSIHPIDPRRVAPGSESTSSQ